MLTVDVLVIGGGPAGLAAAIAAHQNDAQVLLIEREARLGGILKQCIHDGFGLVRYGEKLSGPEYAGRFIDEFHALGLQARTLTFVTRIQKTVEGFAVTLVNRDGVETVAAKALVLATGCRERTAKQVSIHGTRPAGVFTAGCAQHFTNLLGQLPTRKCVILRSGDIGLIMARRMTLEGAHVACVAELMPFSGGLKRNIVQCLNDFDIPLKLSHTVVNIEGKERVSGVTIAEVGPDRKPIPGTEIHYDCDTLLLSCGLIPENELSRGMGVEISPVTNGPVVDESLQTSIPGVFAAGNVLHVHDLVDYVSEEAAAAGRAAVRYLAQGETGERHEIPITIEGGIRYTVPASIDPKLVQDDLLLRFRVGGVMKKRVVKLYLSDEAVVSRKRPVMAPGEMEELKLTKDMLAAHPGLSRIHITVEEA